MTTRTVEEHFSGRAAQVREIYRQIVDASSTLGPVVQGPKKTSIHLNRRTVFAGVQTRKDALILLLLLGALTFPKWHLFSMSGSTQRWQLPLKNLAIVFENGTRENFKE